MSSSSKTHAILFVMVLFLDERHVAEPLSLGDLRLVNGANEYEGRVEIYIQTNGDWQWWTVCDDSWGVSDAEVACRQLGYGPAVDAPGVAYFGQGDKGIYLDDVGCDGTENSLLDCPSIIGNHNCGHHEDAGVVCLEQQEEGTLRLADGNANGGRLEVYLDDVYLRWGAICSDGWGLNETNTACALLGFNSTQNNATFTTYETTVDIEVSSVECVGNETNILECSYERGSGSCTSDRTVYMQCGQENNINSYIRLVDGNFIGQGRLEIYHNGQWGTVCDDNWSTTNANVVCRELGYESATEFYINVNDVDIPEGSGPIWLDDVSCAGTESSLFSCSHYGWGIHNCNHNEDVAVVCTTENYDADIRLMDAPNSYSGRVELYHDGSWSTVCESGWDMADAEVACKMAGFQGAEEYDTDGSFGQGTGNIILSNLDCTGAEDSLLQCTHSGLYTHTCSHTNDVGVVCRNKDIRLVGGSTETEGRVEIFYDGDWATICDDAWGIKDGHVVCQQLGYGTVSYVYSEAYFGPGTGLIALDEVQCTGTESELSECPASDWGVHDCSHFEDASVVCGPLENGAVRLVDGNSMYEGRVEVYHNNAWGTVCDDNWHLIDGDVVCNQLGYGYALYVYSNAYFGEGTGQSILLDDVGCTGNELEIGHCSHNGWGSHNCHHREDAGVRCSGSSGGVGDLSMGTVVGIIFVHVFIFFTVYALCKYCQSHGNNTNCSEKVSSLCGTSTETSVNNIQRPTLFTVASVAQTREATISHDEPYETIDISGVGQDSHWNPSSRTRGRISMLPPTYESSSQMNANSLHGFPTTYNPPSNMQSPYQPHSYAEYSFTEQDHSEIPNTPPPSYESVIEGNDCNNQHLVHPYQSANEQTTFEPNYGQFDMLNASHLRANAADGNLTPVGD